MFPKNKKNMEIKNYCEKLINDYYQLIIEKVAIISGLNKNPKNPKIIVKDGCPNEIKKILVNFGPGYEDLMLEYQKIVSLLKDAERFRKTDNFLHQELIGMYRELQERLDYLIQERNKSYWRDVIIRSDILGVYCYNDKECPEIIIYWEVIHSFCEAHRIDFKNLILVVLTHEIGHYISHLGLCNDEKIWDHRKFSEANKKIKEGLTQYYTQRLSNALKIREEFEALLSHQSENYAAFQEDFAEYDLKAVELALIETRKFETLEYEDFLSLIKTSASIMKILKKRSKSNLKKTSTPLLKKIKAPVNSVQNPKINLSLDKIPGIGSVYKDRLEKAGIQNIMDLVQCNLRRLADSVLGVDIPRAVRWKKLARHYLTKLNS